MKKIAILVLVIALAACKGPEPRKPVKQSSGNLIKASILRNKKLLEKEENLFLSIIEDDSLVKYIQSPAGAWFYYNQQNSKEIATAKPDDLVTITYSVLSLHNDTIYSNKEIDTLTFRVDKKELFIGLRESIKLLKENETATFLYPSSLAYGYHGDDNKIGTNTPLKVTLSILKIDKKSEHEN